MRGRGEQALSIRVLEADISTYLVFIKQSCSISRRLMAAPAQTTLQVCGRGGKHSPSECRRQTRARTLTLPLPRTVEQPQA